MQTGAVDATDIPPCAAQSLGAFLEFAHIFPQLLVKPSEAAWLDPRHFRRFVTHRETPWFVEDPHPYGFVPVSTMISSPLVWTDVINRLKRLSIAAGFSNDHSGKFVAAIGELWGNIVDHSQRSDTGYIAFSLESSRFEFVVADHGIGVLASLKSNPAYAHLTDHGRAIELVLSEGVSRYYTENGHGFGFRPLFVGLANIARSLRFRSGDHAREVIRADAGTPESRTYELASLPGFFCSVLCAA
ncbi:ATP-binding protein [Rhizobium sp. P44RR-XXIV]|uniref:ATP-binding protein n=1 Tax=Rhizobium sp. P44RR-XXIV TaxID=1921145 RepID=UPI0010AA4AFF|nr:ATP-binding protein [Rhizobium sp. P44RR-XXIV]TIX92774.1 ATP-binding protein [Rhizobium sp. P44RR-XXIV]